MDVGYQGPDSHADERSRARALTWQGRRCDVGGQVNVAPEMERRTLVLDETAEPGDFLTGCDSGGSTCLLPVFDKDLYLRESKSTRVYCL
jgi:hypothetical protein